MTIYKINFYLRFNLIRAATLDPKCKVSFKAVT